MKFLSKFKDWIIQILRGVVIGIANIIPGVSGGTMMVSMGIYDTLIHCITHLFKQFKKSILTLLPYAIGMVVGIVALASLLDASLTAFPLPTFALFIGLILGGLSPLVKKIDKKKLNLVAVLAFVLFFALVVVMGVLNDVPNPDSVTVTPGVFVVLILVGVLASATMIIPGVSGSMMLMLVGYYGPVLGAVNTLKDAVFALDFAAMVQPILVLAPFGIGIVAGIFLVAKLIEWLMARYPTPTYCGVLGLVLASPVAILLNPTIDWSNVPHIIAGVATFVIGFVAAMMLARLGKEPETTVKSEE